MVRESVLIYMSKECTYLLGIVIIIITISTSIILCFNKHRLTQVQMENGH